MADSSAPATPLPDEDLVARVVAGETQLFAELMRRYNQRLYRVARAILRDDGETEDVMQQAYLQAYAHLPQFASRARFSTWLTRIAINEALGRRRARRADRSDSKLDEDTMAAPADARNPEDLAYGAELRHLLETSIDTLPDPYRLVFVCREVEGLSTAETAASLEIGEEAVKTRLHRARALLRSELYSRAGSASVEAFTFLGPRCEAMVQRVLAQLTGPPR